MQQLVQPKLGFKHMIRVSVEDLQCSNGAVFSDFIDTITANSDDLQQFSLIRVNC